MTFARRGYPAVVAYNTARIPWRFLAGSFQYLSAHCMATVRRRGKRPWLL